jgi:hypothetical protein
MQLTIHWKNDYYSRPDEDIDNFVERLISSHVKGHEESIKCGNMLVVDAFRVQRKLGKLTALNLEYNGNFYRVDADGRWLDTPPQELFLFRKYLIQIA